MHNLIIFSPKKGKMAHSHILLHLTISIVVISLNCDNCNAAIASFGFEKPVMDLSNLDLEEMDEWVIFKAAPAQHRLLQSFFFVAILLFSGSGGIVLIVEFFKFSFKYFQSCGILSNPV